MFHFGFSYVGLIYLLMLFIPNIIWTKRRITEGRLSKTAPFFFYGSFLQLFSNLQKTYIQLTQT